MKANEQTLQQLDRAIRKIVEKFPANEEANLMTDIHIRVTQDSGELMGSMRVDSWVYSFAKVENSLAVSDSMSIWSRTTFATSSKMSCQ